MQTADMESAGTLSLYRSCTPVKALEYRPNEDRSLTETIVTAVADLEDISPLDLPPLYEATDPEVLHQLIENFEASKGQRTVICFEYRDWNIFVRNDGCIEVCDAADQRSPCPVFADASS